MTALTHQQRKCLDFIRSYWLEHGCSPSYDEIAPAIGVTSRGRVTGVVAALKAAGRVTSELGKRRSVQIVPQSVLSVELPPALLEFVQIAADQAHVTPEAIVIETIRDSFLRSSR